MKNKYINLFYEKMKYYNSQIINSVRCLIMFITRGDLSQLFLINMMLPRLYRCSAAAYKTQHD